MGVSHRNDDGDERTDVLLVAADPRDARLVSCGFQRQSVSHAVVPDGRAAIECLTAGSTSGTDDSLPRLVVLDLAVESVDAETVLHAVKSSPRLGMVPVVVLGDDDESDTAASMDVERAYDLGANAHVTKPDDVERYVEDIERLATFWFEWATFPPESLFADRM
jgi:CheY-like chemotaxis protein